MDEVSTKVISSALTMYDIMERRITLVEKLELNRQPFPDIDVIYLATPTQTSVQKIAKDFENKLKPRYGNVHIYFLESVMIFLKILYKKCLSNNRFIIIGYLRFICSDSKQFCPS